MIRSAAGLIISLIILSSTAADCSGGSNGRELKVFAVKYGVSQFPRSFIFYGDKSRKKVPFCWLFYYIEYGDRKILVDTGFTNDKLRKMFEIEDYKDPVEILKENGINTSSITDVIITHSHFDHIGNADKFPNAKIYINKNEYSSFINGNGLNSVRNNLRSNPAVITFNSTLTLFDFFRIETIGGHTVGSSVVFFNPGKDEYCITGDEVYLNDNITSGTGNGSVSNHSRNISFINEIIKTKTKTLILHDSYYYSTEKRFIQIIP